MNTYRLFYYQLIQSDLDGMKWRSAIEKNPRHPKPRALSAHWTSGFAIAMFIVNTTYVCLGVYLWEGRVSNFALLISFAAMLAIHAFLAASELKTKDIDLLEKSDMPIDELLKKIHD